MKKKYEIKFAKKAAKFFAKQPLEQQKRIAIAIAKLPEGDAKPIKGYKDLYRLRVGDYRIIYTIKENELVILILVIGNRGDIYKKL